MDKLKLEQENIFLKVKEELESTLDKRVDEHLEKDRNLIKETIATVATVFKWTVGIAALLVAILGVKTYNDIQNKIDSAIQNNIHSKIESSNVLSKYESGASNLYNKALIESYTIRIKSNKANKKFFREKIDENDYNRILTIIEDKETEEKDFSNCINILKEVELNDGIKTEPVSKRLSGILLNRDNKFSWIEYQDEKKRILLNNIPKFGGEDCKTYAEEIVKNTKSNILNRIAAISYLKQTNDIALFDIARKLYNSEQDEELDEALLNAVAYINWEQIPLVKNYIDKVNFATLQMSEARKVIDILNQIVIGIEERSKRSFLRVETKKEESYNDASVDYIANTLVKLSPYIQFGFSNYESSTGIYILKKGESGIMYGIKPNILFSRESLIPNKILHTTDLNLFKKYADFFTIKSSIFNDNEIFCSVAVNLELGGAIKAGTMTIDKDIVSGNAWFYVSSNKLNLKFWDKAGNFQTVEVTGFETIEKLKFYLKSIKSIDSDQIEKNDE